MGVCYYEFQWQMTFAKITLLCKEIERKKRRKVTSSKNNIPDKLQNKIQISETN